MNPARLLLRSCLLSAALAAAALPACSSSSSSSASSRGPEHLATTTRALVAPQSLSELLVLRNGSLLGVSSLDGSASAVGSDDWTGSRTIASIGGTAYAVQGASLYAIDPTAGARTVLGSGDWTGTSQLATFDGWLYAIQGAGMYRINPADGSYARLGTGDWTGTSALVGDAVDATYLYAVQGAALYRVDPFGGTSSRVGTGDWTGTNVLSGYRGWLYAVQGAGLWRINPTDGTWTLTGSGDWTGTSALTSDTRGLFATQATTLYAIDPVTGAFGALDSVDWTGAVAITATTTTKPQKTLVMSPDQLRLDILGALTGMRLQLDQSGDPTHAKTLSARHPECVPASSADIAACRAQCVADSGGDPVALKACYQTCANLQNCTSVCDAHATADYLTLGQSLKSLAQKTCTSPDVSCPPCDVGDGGQTTSAVEDVDLTEWVPTPLFTHSVAGAPFSCTLNMFGFDTTDPTNPNFAYNFVGDFHLDLTAYATTPTINCNNGYGLTVTDPHVVLDISPQVVNHHPTVAITTNFSGHLDYAWDWIYSLDTTLASAVDGAIGRVVGQYQGSIDSQFEKWLAAKILQNNGDQVDDYLDVRADVNGITVVYTPLCVDGICSCTPDCSNRSCGTDTHCGSSVCGSCSVSWQSCDDKTGTCVCTPQCDGKSCGLDGCGGTCGACGVGTLCNATGQCVCDPSTSCGSAPPVITSVSPSSGSTAGGYTVTIQGQNFAPGATSFAFGGFYATSVTCSSMTTCTVVVPQWESPDTNQVVDVQAYVGTMASAKGTQDQFSYIGTGPVCSGYWTCNSAQSEAFFQCDPPQPTNPPAGQLQLYRQSGTSWVPANATVSPVGPQETDIFELNYVPPAGQTTVTYKVCNLDTLDNVQTCATPITLTATQCTCTPQTCAQLGDTCGTASDGCGGTLQCGTCPAGQSCSSNECCPTGYAWNGSICAKSTTCTTAACRCASQGGTWTGKYCE